MTQNKPVSKMSDTEIKEEIKRAYADLATASKACCQDSSCCNKENSWSPRQNRAKLFGYPVDQLPESLTDAYAGCGNPIALASLKEGEVVLDLGSGAGLDAFMAAEKVGATGKVIGIDMTPEMIQKAQENAERIGAKNTDFRLGEIENLPIEDATVDVIISNCVINLAPNKAKVFQEAFRVLRPRGRLLVSDMVLMKQLPEEVRESIHSYTGCIAGAVPESEYLQLIENAGFEQVRVVEKSGSGYVASVRVEAFKPQ
ncbi:MAG: arsenite methyltransferase [Candidatus Thorarchaeota archaeon]